MGSTIDIKNKLDENQTALLLVSSTDYNKSIIDITKQLSTKNVAYVTLNKTSDSLMELFKKNNVNLGKLFFVDAISKTIKKPSKDAKNCIYCSSPGSLTEISIVINKLLKKEIDYLIFDSINSLLIYEKRSPVSKFISSLVNNIKNSNTKAVFYALSSKEQKELVSESGMFVDVVIDLGKEAE